MKALKHICFYISTILCIVCFLIPNIGKADTLVSLTIELTDEETALPGAEFKLYRIGSHLNSEGRIELSEPFASHFTITLENMTDWDELAEDVAAFIETENIPYTDVGVTDANGKAAFPTSGDLRDGLYFVSAATATIGSKTYTTLPFILLLPSWDRESESWIYNVTAQPKIGVEEPTPTPTATPSPTPSPTPSATPGASAAPSPSPSQTPLPGTGVEWRPTFWLSGFGVFFLLLSIATGIAAFRKGKEKQ